MSIMWTLAIQSLNTIVNRNVYFGASSQFFWIGRGRAWAL